MLFRSTQNPIEQEGTYPLPEAQLDRFLMHVKVDFPDARAEHEILRLSRVEASRTAGKAAPPEVIPESVLFAAREEALAIHMAESVEQYIVQLTTATRQSNAYGDDLARWIEFGVSPRATISLDRCSRAHAWLAGRDFVSPDDVREVLHDIFRHRLLLTFEAEANGQTADKVIDELLNRVPVA